VPALRGRLEREARLSGAARARQRHEPVLDQQLLQRAELGPAPDEPRRRRREIRRIERPQRREGREPELEELLALAQVLEPVHPERRAFEHVTEQRPRAFRQHHLPSVCDGADAGGSVHVDAHVVIVVDLRLARVMPIRTRTGPPSSAA